ncbi:Hypothetical predicted protein, partial [Paramuricea clavata]
LNQGVIELAPTTETAKEFYIPHKGIERKQTETTKLRVVYDASAIESGFQPSLKPPPRPPLSRTCCGTFLLDLDFTRSKSRIAKRNLSIPRLELISGNMTVNLATNIQQALTTHPATVHCWLDSTVALYWINDQ